MTMRLRTKVLISLPALILTVIVAGLAIVVGDVGDSQRRGLRLILELALDRDVEIDGTVTWTRSRWLTLTVTNLRLPAAAGFEASDLATIGRGSIQLALSPLFSGHVVLPQISFRDVAINLEIDANGNNNWSNPAAASDTDSDDTLLVPLIETLALENVAVHYLDRASGNQREFKLISLTKRQREGEDETTIEGSGQLNGRPVRLSGSR